MKVIFLDVDGVLNSNTFADDMFKNEGARIFCENILDKRAIGCLRQIVLRTDAIIVLSSSWRLHHRTRKALCEQLAEFDLFIHSDTPYTGLQRGDDITAWFEDHSDMNVKSYVILDDNSDMGNHIDHLVHTSFYGRGLESSHVDRAVAILSNVKTKGEKS